MSHYRITTIGKGKRQALELSDMIKVATLKHKLNLRLEFVINSKMSYDNVCL